MALPRWLTLVREETREQQEDVPNIPDDARLRVLDVDGTGAVYSADREAKVEVKRIVINGAQAKKLVRKGEGYIVFRDGEAYAFRFTKSDSFLAEIQARRARKLTKEGWIAMPRGVDNQISLAEDTRTKAGAAKYKKELLRQNKEGIGNAPDQENYNPSSECRLGREKAWVRLSPMWRAGMNQRYAKNSRMGKNAKAKAKGWKEDYLEGRKESSVAGYRFGESGQVETRVCLVRRLDDPDDEMKKWNWTVLGRSTEATVYDTRSDITASSYEARTSFSGKVDQRPRVRGSGHAEGQQRTGQLKQFAVPARQVPCEKCGVQKGDPCISPLTGKRTTTHKIRIEDYIEERGDEDENN